MSSFSASTSVMARRAPELVEQDDPQRALWRKLDFYPTPPWAARAGLGLILAVDPRAKALWEPACGQGHIAGPLREMGMSVAATDLHDFGFGGVHDFLSAYPPLHLTGRGAPEWVITNPPFRHAAEFVRKGLEVASRGVAVLCRLAFMETTSRYQLLFGAENPVHAVAPFMERVPMQLGAYKPAGDTATAYAWFLWTKDEARRRAAPELWPIPPGTRDRLTRSDDAHRWGSPEPAPLLEVVGA